MLCGSISGLDSLMYLFNVCLPTWGLCTPWIRCMSLRRPQESTESLELELWASMWVLGTKPTNSKISSRAMSLPLRGLVFLTSFKKSRRGKEESKREMEARKKGSRPEGWWCRRALICVTELLSYDTHAHNRYCMFTKHCECTYYRVHTYVCTVNRVLFTLHCTLPCSPSKDGACVGAPLVHPPVSDTPDTHWGYKWV